MTVAMPFDAAATRAQFPLLARSGLHYLDSGATSQMPQAVLDAVVRFETTSRANVLRSVHRLAEAATDAYEGARRDIAGYLNVADDEIVFTSGTTAGINLVARSFGDGLQPGDEIVVSLMEHHANFVPWQMLRDRHGIVLKILPLTGDGRLDLGALARTVTPRCRLIALTHASNVTGAVTDVAPVVAAARAVGAKVLLDGAQRLPHGPVDLKALDVDFYAFSSHKMFGPTGVGVLWARKALLEAMPPFLGGGEMIRTVTLERTIWADVPHKFEAGTPPIAQAVGLGAAVRWLRTLDWPSVSAHEMRLTQRLLDGLGQVKGTRVVGPTGLQGRIPVVSFDIDGAHPHDICQILDGYGVALRGGHHCAQPLMDHLGLAGTTRASLALYNNDADIDALLKGLDAAAMRLR
jgi:cysteine desulfurase / selenocysteine lyase